jgi:hypothetical protein
MSKTSSLRRRHRLDLWLEKGVLDRPTAARVSYSDVILRLAEEEAA